MERQQEILKLLELVNTNLKFFEDSLLQLQTWKKTLLLELNEVEG